MFFLLCAILFALFVLFIKNDQASSLGLAEYVEQEEKNRDVDSIPFLESDPSKSNQHNAKHFVPAIRLQESGMDDFLMNKQRTIDEWVDVLLNQVPDERFIELPSSLLDSLITAIRAQESIYFRLLESISGLPSNEKRLFIQRVVAQGTNEQKKLAIEQLMYTGNPLDVDFAISLTFSLNTHKERVNVIQHSFTAGLESPNVATLLQHLASSKNKALAEAFSQEIYQVYFYSAVPEIRYQALMVLFKNTKEPKLSMSHLLVNANTEETKFILKIARDVMQVDPAKLGGLDVFHDTLVDIVADPNQDQSTKALAEEFLSIKF